MTSHQGPSILDLTKIAAWPFALALAAVSLCYLAAGESLGFYLGSVFAVTLILPPLVAGETRGIDAAIVAGAIVDAVGIAWLIAVFGPNLTFAQWLACYVALAAYALALAGIVWLIRPVVGQLTAGAFAVLLGIAWLTWPVWTSPFLTRELAAWLTPAHPLFAINRVLLDHGVWMQQRVMYRYATLGQDVAYALPRSIWPCVFVHGIIAALPPSTAALRARWSRRAGAAGPPAAPTASS
jgi:hypothetical protein